ncbi:MAG: dicarboxylate/amino acid:cation symporter [Andreesenia angusta]|nr:dicarboxylate/amino acid:cation symporter [Andreesenia angusta]
MAVKKKKELSLTSKIFIGLISGVILGIILHYLVPDGNIKNKYLVDGLFQVVGQGFIRGMQMLVVPLVFASLVTGSMSMGDSKKLGKVGVRAIIFYIFTTSLAIASALFIGNLINPGKGMNMSISEIGDTTAKAMEAPNFTETLLDIIPTNPINGLAEGNMLQLIFFALIVGVLLAKLGQRVEGIANLFSELNELMMEMTMLVMKVAPIGVFCLVARTFSDIGFEALAELLKYTLGVISSLAVQCLIIYMLLLKIFTGVNPFKFLKKFFPVMGFAFSTASSNATVPLSINTLEEMGVSKKVSAFTIPLGATINMDGTAIMQGVAVVFVSQAFNIDLTMSDYMTVIAAATLASIGTAGIPSVGLITLSMVFNSVGLPVEGIAMIMGIDRILDMTRTAINVTGDAVCTTIAAHQNDMLDREQMNS